MEYGYARVSARDQNEDRQMIALAQAGIAPKYIFLDKQSGKDFQRPQYQRLLRRLRPGDLVVVKAIDRLGRNYREILEQWRIITRERKADIRVLDMPLLDTRGGGGDLTGIFISDLVLQILSYVAETERQNIRQRQAEGIAAARARGVRFGAKRLAMPEEFDTVQEEWLRGELSARAAGARLGISCQTFLRRVKERAKDAETCENNCSNR